MNRILRLFLRGLFCALYRLEVEGIEHLIAAGPNAVIAPNHVSFLDPGVIRAIMLQDNPVYAIDTARTRQWWVKVVLRFGRAHPVDPVHPFAVRKLIAAARSGETVVVFPEGRLTVTGRPMKIYDGAAFIAAKAGVPLIPVRIDGIEPSPFSRVSGAQVRRRWFPRVKVTIFPALRPGDPWLDGRACHHALAARLRGVMLDLPFATFNIERTIIEATTASARAHGGRRCIIADQSGRSERHRALLARAAKLGARLAPLSAPGKAVGVLLPNDCDAVAAVLGLIAAGRVPAMIDCGRDPEPVLLWCRATDMNTVVTSRACLQDRTLAGLVASLAHIVRIVLIEELDRVDFALGATGPHKLLVDLVRPGDSALILHGSHDRVVVFSHRDLLSRAARILAHVDLTRTDRIFSALPLSHPMGFMAGALLPLLCGARSMLYAGSSHPGLVADALYNSNATVLFDTVANLAGYARTANPLDFRSLRYVFACDGPIAPELQQAFHEKFGLRILPCPGRPEAEELMTQSLPIRDAQAA